MATEERIREVAAVLWQQACDQDGIVADWLDTTPEDSDYHTAVYKVFYRCMSALFLSYEDELFSLEEARKIMEGAHPFITHALGTIHGEREMPNCYYFIAWANRGIQSEWYNDN